MAVNLDLPTVLFLLKTSYVAGGTGLAYVRWYSRDGAGTGAMATAYLIQALGSTLAGLAEVDHPDYAWLSLINLGLGLLGYTLLIGGGCELSSRKRRTGLSLLHLVPAAVVLVGVTTGFHARSDVRGALFNAAGAATYLLLAVRFRLDFRHEELPARNLLALVFTAAGLTCALLAVEFGFTRFAIVTPATGFVFVVTFKFMVALFSVILVLERTNRKLDRLAHTDTLTEIGNRRSFYDAAPAHPGVGDAVVLFDADRFKHLNDAFGHDFGDAVLRRIASDLSSALRRDDVLARFGGEEFILFLPGAGEAVAGAVADRARAAVSRTEHHGDGRDVRVSVSAGLAVCSEAGCDLSTLVRRADTALYAAKRDGGDRCRLHTPALDADGEGAPERPS